MKCRFKVGNILLPFNFEPPSFWYRLGHPCPQLWPLGVPFARKQNPQKDWEDAWADQPPPHLCPSPVSTRKSSSRRRKGAWKPGVMVVNRVGKGPISLRPALREVERAQAPSALYRSPARPRLGQGR